MKPSLRLRTTLLAVLTFLTVPAGAQSPAPARPAAADEVIALPEFAVTGSADNTWAA